jgi:biopolymer transport protein ExbD
MDHEPDLESGFGWEEIQPDLTPLIDCVFLLLIFFMVAMVFARPVDVKVVLAEARNPAAVRREHRVQLVITKAGDTELQGEPVEMTGLESALRGLVEADEKIRLTVLVDREAAHAHTLQAMEAAQRAGLGRVFLATRTRAAGGGAQ